MLGFLADRGGEVPWDWSKVNPDAKAMIANLMNEGLVIDREYVTHAAAFEHRLVLRLTDRGRAVVEQIQKATPAAS